MQQHSRCLAIRALSRDFSHPNLLSALALFVLLVVSVTPVQSADEECQSSPSLQTGPQAVVETVIEALRSNGPADNGIATVYCFASPGNKQMTGPFKRFAQMIKSGYGDMLNHSESEFEPIEIRDEVAMQPVWLTTSNGAVAGYLFRLGKQTDGEFSGMWMTEAVYRLDESKRPRSI